LSFHEEIVVNSENDRREVAAIAQAIVEKNYTSIPFPSEEFATQVEELT
jgi:hypothetical protein